MDFWNKKKLADANEQIKALRHSLDASEAKVQELQANKDRLTKARDELKATLDRIRALEANQSPVIAVSQAERMIQDKDAEIADYKAQLESAKKTHTISEEQQEKKWAAVLAKKESEILEAQKANLESLIQRVHSDIETLIEQRTTGFPWLAESLGEYYANLDKIYAEYLQCKPHPALVQAERIREIAQEKARFKKEYTIMRYVLLYYEGLFPWLREYVGLNADELIAEAHILEDEPTENDQAQRFLSAGEFQRLKPAERNQIALDRYWLSRKTNWQIGRDYERFVGYLYEQQGYKVQYFGIERGVEDLGRDLICIKDGLVEVVQCKYWSKAKGMVIREAYVNQLFGTTVKHYIDSMSSSNTLDLSAFMRDYDTRIKASMVTSTTLSEEAMRFARALGITVRAELDMDKNYPCIKCNINQQTGEKIYHLPFDQQYDRVVINARLGEFYAHTVAEAEKRGFRRAWRWQGNNLA